MSIHGYKKAVVTGASSGIGRATVRALHEHGIEILAIARRADKLDALASETGCDTLATDIRDTGAIKNVLVEFAPDILVNSAGVGHGMTGLETVDASAIEEAVAVNVLAPLQTTAMAIEGMKSRGRGHIVNIGSISGIHTMASALYGATKSAVHQLSQNLRMELRGTGIRMTELCPGRVRSEFYDAAQGDRTQMDAAKDTGISELRPEDIAGSILFALQAPLHVNISTIEMLPTEQAVGGFDITPIQN